MTQEQEAVLRKARESLRGARILEADGLFDFAISRAYYSMFYVARAFLLGKGLSFSKHGSLIGAFGQHFAKTGIIDARFHHNLIAAFNARVKGDYEAVDTAGNIIDKHNHTL